MLTQAQGSPELWIGKYAKLNYDTATAVSEQITVFVNYNNLNWLLLFQILNSMYTMTMMLVKMVD